MPKNLYLPIIVILLLVCGGTSAQALTQDYIVGDGDLLRITVYDNADLLTIVRIGGEGTILFPLIGQVKVSGLSVTEVAKKIEKLLASGYINSPHVSVFIEEYRSQKATIMGQVSKPGLYELKGYTTFLELLSKAGDLTKDAGDIAIIKRKPEAAGKAERIITIDLKRLVEKGDTSQDQPVIDGDSIYVIKAGVFFVTGEIKKPDSYKIEEGITVLKAITMAGGFTDRAATGRVKIIRKTSGKEELLEKVRMDEMVRPDDVIVVPESFF
ncbi:MAG: periplasmic polysaccharide biosynthesis/export protein [Nitrospirae bacterium]|nr:MAG: periplasmic polysaccharide biosynthesis/export protein [Nitrospirota bacterium]